MLVEEPYLVPAADTSTTPAILSVDENEER
jgi:hypothetical protein